MCIRDSVNTIKEHVVESVEKQVKSKLNQIVNTSNITKSSAGIINSSNVCSSNNSYNKEFRSDNDDVESGNVIENVIPDSDDIIVSERVIESERVNGEKWGVSGVVNGEKLMLIRQRESMKRLYRGRWV